jgi:Tfp pilus assembly protein PilF
VNLGIALQQMGMIDQAVTAMREAVRIDDRLISGHYNLAKIFATAGRLDDAATSYRKAIALNPREAWFHVNLGIVLQQQHKLDEATESLRRAVTLAPDLAPARTHLANALHERGDDRGALAELRQLLATNASDPLTHVMLGQTLQELGDSAGAETAYRSALSLRPGMVAAYAHLSILLQHRGNLDQSRPLLDYAALLMQRRLPAVEGWRDLAAFNSDLAAYIRRHPSLVRDPPAKATTQGSQSGEILNAGDPVIAALQQFFEGAVRDYFATVVPKTPALFPEVKDWRLHGWAVVLRSGGYQTPHFHPDAALSGVYYVQVPDVVREGQAGEAGHIRFGEPQLGAGRPERATLTQTIKPEEGLLILFPAYFWHNTVPFESRQDRICIAFDVQPAR